MTMAKPHGSLHADSLKVAPLLLVFVMACSSTPVGDASSGTDAGLSDRDGGADRDNRSPSLLSLVTNEYNPSKLDVGHISAVVDEGDTVDLLTDKGALKLSGGGIVASDPSVTTWSAATQLPAPDGSSVWAVAVDRKGQLFHLHASGTLENISDRFGLASHNISALVPSGKVGAVFALEKSIAASDGARVTFYDFAFPGGIAASGGGGLLVGITAQGRMHTLDLAKSSNEGPELDQVKFVAADGGDRLYAASVKTIWRRAQAGWDPVYESANGALHGLAGSHGGVWAADGSELVAIDLDTVARTHGLALPPTATLSSSGGSGVWALASGGAIHYVPAVAPDEAAWQSHVLPIYARICSNCHAPGGSAGVDLSTYAAFAQLRNAVESRLIVKRDMPPAGQLLTDAERGEIAAWLRGPEAGSPSADGGLDASRGLLDGHTAD